MKKTGGRKSRDTLSLIVQSLEKFESARLYGGSTVPKKNHVWSRGNGYISGPESYVQYSTSAPAMTGSVFDGEMQNIFCTVSL